MNSNIANMIELNSLTAKYDESVKELLADKQILARILKYSLAEFSDYEISDIIKALDEPVITQMRVEPGFTNTQIIHKEAQEDSVLGEGMIIFDIRCSVYLENKPIKILINIEAQNSTNPSKLGYHIDNRIIFYLARMISAQKEVEFTHSEYDNLKDVRSIWICMDSADDEDSINRIVFTQETVYGKQMQLDNIHKVQGIIIRLRENENAEESKNVLIAMLEELLKKEESESKKQKLQNEYGVEMSIELTRKVEHMCNLSQVVLEHGEERGIKIGETRGIKIGETRGIKIGETRGENKLGNLISKLMTAGRNDDALKAASDEEARKKFYKEFGMID